MQKYILIVEDEAAVRTALRGGLEDEGYVVSEASSGADALRRLEQHPPVDLVTLDLMLGRENGLELARKIRAKRNVPIIIITGLGAPIDRVEGLEHGADDYIVKSFHILEVLLRLSSVLDRYRDRGKLAGETDDGVDERYECEAGTTDVNRRELRSPTGEKVPLTDAEFDLLVAFLRNPQRVLSRDDLTMQLKGRLWSPTDRTLDGHMARLRKKIEPDV